MSVLNNKYKLYLTYLRPSQQKMELIQESIKQTKIQMMGKRFKVKLEPSRYCQSNPIGITYLDNQDNIQKVVLSKISCNSWTCPSCNVKKALRVKYLIKNTVILNNLDYFLTLTLDPKKIPSDFLSIKGNDTHRYITKLFNNFIVDLKRKTNNSVEKLKYVWVLEFQKNGNAHLHILMNKYVDINLIRSIWTRIGGGHIMRVEEIKSLEGISNYVSEYIVKGLKHDLNKESYFKYFEKRYSISQSCIRPKTAEIVTSVKDIQEVTKKLYRIGIISMDKMLESVEYNGQLVLFERQ